MLLQTFLALVINLVNKSTSFITNFFDWRQWDIPNAADLQTIVLSILLPFTAIFIALLALWAQLTLRITLVNNKNSMESRRKSGTISLFWIYIATGIAVSALAIFIFTTQSNIFGLIGDASSGTPVFGEFLRYFLYRIGLGLLLTSFFMFFAHIVESATSIWIKIRRDKTLTFQLLIITSNEYRKFTNNLIYMALLLGFFSIAGMLLGWRYPICFLLWIGDIVILSVAYTKLLNRVKTEKG